MSDEKINQEQFLNDVTLMSNSQFRKLFFDKLKLMFFLERSELKGIHKTCPAFEFKIINGVFKLSEGKKEILVFDFYDKENFINNFNKVLDFHEEIRRQINYI